MSEGVRNEKTSKKRRENAELFFPAPRDVLRCRLWNVSESAFKFLQFVTYYIISQYFPKKINKFYFHSSFNFISRSIKCRLCVCSGANLMCFVTMFSLYIDFLHNCEIRKEDPCKIISRSLFCLSFG